MSRDRSRSVHKRFGTIQRMKISRKLREDVLNLCRQLLATLEPYIGRRSQTCAWDSMMYGIYGDWGRCWPCGAFAVPARLPMNAIINRVSSSSFKRPEDSDGLGSD